VVGVVVGDQDGVELQAVLVQPGQHTIGFTRVHHQRALAVVEGPDVVVAEGRQGKEFHGSKGALKPFWRVECGGFARRLAVSQTSPVSLPA